MTIRVFTTVQSHHIQPPDEYVSIFFFWTFYQAIAGLNTAAMNTVANATNIVAPVTRTSAAVTKLWLYSSSPMVNTTTFVSKFEVLNSEPTTNVSRCKKEKHTFLHMKLHKNTTNCLDIRAATVYSWIKIHIFTFFTGVHVLSPVNGVWVSKSNWAHDQRDKVQELPWRPLDGSWGCLLPRWFLWDATFARRSCPSRTRAVPGSLFEQEPQVTSPHKEVQEAKNLRQNKVNIKLVTLWWFWLY